MSSVRQPSFAGGELAPTLYGRSDLAKWAVGCRTLRNFFVSPHGAAVNRPGTRYVGPLKNSNEAVPWLFVVSDDEQYILEFGPLYLRFVADLGSGPGPVLSGGVPYEIVTPYTADDLDNLRFSQSGDVLTITCEGYAPRELTLTDDDPLTFTLAEVDFDPPEGALPATPAVLGSTLSAPDLDTGRVGKSWTWQVTTVYLLPTGEVIETAPIDVTTYVRSRLAAWDSEQYYLPGDYVTLVETVGGGGSYTTRDKWVCVTANINSRPSVNNSVWQYSPLATPGSAHRTLPDIVLYSDRPLTVDWTAVTGTVSFTRPALTALSAAVFTTWR